MSPLVETIIVLAAAGILIQSFGIPSVIGGTAALAVLLLLGSAALSRGRG